MSHMDLANMQHVDPVLTQPQHVVHSERGPEGHRTCQVSRLRTKDGAPPQLATIRPTIPDRGGTDQGSAT